MMRKKFDELLPFYQRGLISQDYKIDWDRVDIMTRGPPQGP